MQSTNFFIHLRLISTVFKFGDAHEAQYKFKWFCYEERRFNRQDKLKCQFLFC